MKKFLLCLSCIFMFTASIMSQSFQFKAEDISIEYEKFILPNGLTLVVHEDHKAPIAAVNVWYHVGSKNEKPGKSGFAHLFEHLMFNGSENYNTDYFQALESIGGTDLNGTTNTDRTNYFQNVPISALDQVLFLESDRMGHLLGAIDQAKLDEQRGVVQNEKRQGENQPYGKQWNYLTKSMYPKGHPYSWTVIGEMEDLNAASLEDVQEWFKAYYGAANAVVVVAGDVTAKDVYNRVLKYFGDIPSGPTIERQKVNIPKHNGDTYQEYQDRVPEPRITYAWHSPPYGSREDLQLDLVAAVLSNGKNSRLYKKLIYEDQTASSANAFQASSEIASGFIIQANVKNEKDFDEVKQVLLSELDKFIEKGPTQAELDRVKADYFADFIKGLERIGGFGGVSDILALNETYHNSPGYYKSKLKFIEDATISDLQAVANKWLSKPKHTLVCMPFPEYTITKSTVDRSKLPELGTPKSAPFPEIQRAKLSNGLNIVLAQRKGSSAIVMQMMVDAGFKTDILTNQGTAALAMNMLDEGTKSMNSLQINEQLQLLGATLYTGSDQDVSTVSLNTLKQSFEPSLDVFADVILHPSFPETEFNRLRTEQINDIKNEKSQPFGMVLRSMGKYMYGSDHPYSGPFSGNGYEHTVKEISNQDIREFYKTWFKPNNTTVIVTGDIDIKTLKSSLEKRFGKWKKGSTPTIAFGKSNAKKKNTLYLIDRPESQQSVIVAGHITEKYGSVSEIAVEQMVNVLGGDFTSRINMNLREDKHWAYGAGGLVLNAQHDRPFLVYAPVQTDKSAESVTELRKEIAEFVSTRPVTSAELEKVKTNQILKLPGQWETNNAVNSALYNLVKYNLNDDYYETYDSMVRNLSTSEVNQLSKKMVKPNQINWFLVGDKAKIASKLDNLDFDEIIEIDADGNPISPPVMDDKEKVDN